jgi:hypothetical protein
MMHRSRWGACLLGAALVCGLLMPAAPARAAGAPAEVSNFAIVYRVDPSEDLGAGEIRLWFSAPDRWRIETHTEKREVTVVAAGARVVVEDRTAKGFLVMARDQALPPFDYVPFCLDLSARYRGWAGYAAARKQSLGKCEQGQGTSEVLGRSCRRYQSEFPLGMPQLPPGLLEGPVRMSLCVDDVLLVALEEDAFFGGKLVERIVATSVEVNGDLPESLFTLPIPPGARVFQGGISSVPEEGFSSPATVAEDLAMMVGESVTVYVPSYVPEGFSDLGTMTDGEGKWFRADLASPSGATLVIAESKDLSELPLPNLPDATPVTVGPWHGELGTSQEPFARTVLTWQAGDWRLLLDAAGVPAAEVMKVAASMHLQAGKSPIAFTDPKTVQAQVHFRVLMPTALPPGAQLMASDVTPYEKGAGDTYTPEQISLSYLAPGGEVSFSEMSGGEGMEIPGWERITIAGRPGWYHHDPDFGHEFEWVQDGTDISLTGTLSKEEMLKIAESFVPAAPSARVPAEQPAAQPVPHPAAERARQRLEAVAVPVYPGATDVKRHVMMKPMVVLLVSYQVPVSYPSKAVVDFYDERLRPQGWVQTKALPASDRQWHEATGYDPTHDSGERMSPVGRGYALGAAWRDPQRDVTLTLLLDARRDAQHQDVVVNVWPTARVEAEP